MTRPLAAPPSTADPCCPGWLDLLWRLGHLTAGLVILGLVLANFNPQFGFFHEDRGARALLWPWEVFRGASGVEIDWLPAHVWLLTFTLSGLCLLLAAFVRRGSLRAGLALTAAGLVGTAVLGYPLKQPLATGMNLALALLVGGALAARRGSRNTGSNRLAFLAWLTLGIFLVLPLPNPAGSTDDENVRDYQSIATGILDHISVLAAGEGAAPLDPSNRTYSPTNVLDVLLGSIQAYSWVFAFVFGGLAVLLPGRWWLQGITALMLLTALVGQPYLVALDRIREVDEALRTRSGGSETSLDGLWRGLKAAAELGLVALRPILLPLALGLGELLRPRLPSRD